ncbi:MAG: 50S ribosomal protein L25/general stress protein Ctc [Nocardioidaceae bacterium]
MSNETSLPAESRTEFGKGAARRLRRASKVPAVLYGHGTDPIHISLPDHDTLMALKHGGANALLSIELDGRSQLALPKQVQRDPLRGDLEHLDLLIVRKGEKVTVEVPIVLVGEAVSDALVTTEQNTVSVEAEATHLPESIEVSVEKAEVGTQIHARDLVLPAGAALQIDEDALIVNVTAAPTAAQVDAELAEAEAGAGIEHEAPAAEAAPAEAAAE